MTYDSRALSISRSPGGDICPTLCRFQQTLGQTMNSTRPATIHVFEFQHNVTLYFSAFLLGDDRNIKSKKTRSVQSLLQGSLFRLETGRDERCDMLRVNTKEIQSMTGTLFIQRGIRQPLVLFYPTAIPKFYSSENRTLAEARSDR